MTKVTFSIFLLAVFIFFGLILRGTQNASKIPREDMGGLEKKVFLDINAFQDTSPEAPYEAQSIYRLAVINMEQFFKEGELIKIIVFLEGEQEDLVSEYLFSAGELEYVKKVKTLFAFPKWKTESSQKIKKQEVIELFFSNNILQKYLLDGGEVNLSFEEIEERQEKILHDLAFYQHYADNTAH